MDPLKDLRMATADPEKQLQQAAAKSLILPAITEETSQNPPLNLRMIGLGVLLDIPDQTKDITEKGIIVPGNVRRRMGRVMVVDVLGVGEDVSTVKKGDRVLVDAVTLNPAIYDSRPYWITTPASIIAVVEPLRLTAEPIQ